MGKRKEEQTAWKEISETQKVEGKNEIDKNKETE
jgi:hypothetical protein